jgi:septal ring factor EnvC (AmiA/AmiB activator)
LRVLLEQLEHAQKKQHRAAFVEAKPTGSGQGVSRKMLSTPIAGRIIRAWGAPTEAGPAMGISYQAGPGARVAAPCSGRVLFAAPFRSYGNLLILDCGGGYAAVLAGFDQLDVRPGQLASRGAQVGTLPARGSGRSPGPALYFELRRNGEPIDPGPWLR